MKNDIICRILRIAILNYQRRVILFYIFKEEYQKIVIRTHNGSQAVSYKFSECCKEIHIEHERITVKTLNKSIHIESFHRVL